jgi:hypothetical protein
MLDDIVMAVLVPIAGAFGYVIKVFADWYFKRKKPLDKRILPTLSLLVEELNNITANTDSTRALLLKCENGGGVPRLGSELYSSVVLEDRKKGGAVRASWDKRRLDAPYITMLTDLDKAELGELLVNKKDIKGSVLYDTYDSQGTEFTKLFTIYSHRKGWFYLSCTFSKITDKLSTDEITAMRDAATRIRNIIRRNKDII